MTYFVIHKRSLNGDLVGMSKMPWPVSGMKSTCALHVAINEERGTKFFVVRRNARQGWPIEWEDVYCGYEIPEAQFETYREMRVARVLRDDFINVFIKRFTKTW